MAVLTAEFLSDNQLVILSPGQLHLPPGSSWLKVKLLCSVGGSFYVRDLERLKYKPRSPRSVKTSIAVPHAASPRRVQGAGCERVTTLGLAPSCFDVPGRGSRPTSPLSPDPTPIRLARGCPFL